MNSFKVIANYTPQGDQPEAIAKLTESLKQNHQFQTLLGITGSGKTFTMAKIIENVQKPSLIISHNKTLAAQLYRELKSLFPENAVEYFVSYYDYYQPEAYVPQKDLYIEKDSSVNEEIDKLRLRATSSLIEREDVIIVASVSCIYGLGSPEDYKKQVIVVKKNTDLELEVLLNQLIFIQYERNDIEFSRGKFRVRGDYVDIFPAYSDDAIKIEFFDRTIENIYRFNPLTNEVKQKLNQTIIYPAKHFITSPDTLKTGIENIKKELAEREEYFKKQKKLVEAQRLHTKTMFDIEMLLEMGYCNGIENYSRHLSGRMPGSPAATLLDYFQKDFLVFIDESHVTIPQLKAMYRGDRARKDNLVNFGFRLPSSYDNRPLYFEEFLDKAKKIVFLSATPGDFEMENSAIIAEQIIRPTGLLDPEVIVRPAKTQINDLIAEIEKTVNKGFRVLVTALTKKMSEDLSSFLLQKNIKTKYLHSEISTIERVEILRDLRKGEFDCLVGVNLLREGLDLPEVALVAILDADKEGFLRSHTSLIQTIGRAARNAEGRVILYADEMTKSIEKAINETKRRREKQLQYNKAHNITPKTIKKEIVDILESQKKEAKTDVENIIIETKNLLNKNKKISDDDYKKQLKKQLEKRMFELAENLEFEKAAYLRDFIKDI